MFYVLLFIFGASLASFLHVYATRALREETIFKPKRSYCCKCHHTLKWYELIPIVSYIIQKGRCRKCNSKIGIDTFLVEIITGLLFVLVFAIYGYSYESLIGFVIVLMTISICITDFKGMIILDSTLIVGGILIYALIFLSEGWRGIYHSFMYGIFAFVLFFLVKIWGDAAFKRESLGGGDIKFAFIMGSVLPYSLFLASMLLGSSMALPYALFATKRKDSSEFAFGPFLAIGLLVVFLFQNDIISIVEKVIE